MLHLFQEQKNRSNLTGIEHFTKILVPKTLMKNFTLKLRINFRKLRKNYFGYYLKTDKDISKIPTDSDSAEQQLNDSKKL